MRRWGIRKKVLVVTLVPTLLTTLMLGLFFTYSWVNNIESLLKDRGESLSRQLAAGSEYGLFTANRSLLSSLSNALLEEQDVRSITFFGSDGSRLLHTGPGSSETVQSDELTAEHATRISRKNSTRFITPVFLQDLMIESMLDPDARQSMSNLREPLGWVVVEMSHIRTEKETYKALLISLLLILGGVILSMAIALRLSRAFTNPVFELNEAVAKLKEGKLDTRVYTGAGPEFEQLESGLNAMAEELSKAQAEMQQNIDQATEDLRETLETIEIQNIELDFARKEALEASRIKSEFLANMSHEIRTPLMHLDQRLVKALQEPLPPNVSARIVDARADIRRLVGMLESLLDIASSKARTGDRHGLAPVNLSELATRICNLYADSAEESNHSFVWDIAPGVCLDGEESQLTRLMTNLLDNAFKYVPEGGTITLTLQPGPVLTVADDGPGVPPNHAERIFERFYRGDGREAGQTGSGLGLALARAIAERHGLTITLEPVDKGASFRVGRETE